MDDTTDKTNNITRIPLATIKERFPLFARHPGLAYLDSTASAQKADVVLDAMDSFHREHYANVHRGIYPLSEEATALYEQARSRVAKLINALPQEVIFTSGTTDSINKAARMLVHGLNAGDEIVITVAEHHSNLIPWQQLAKERGLTLKAIPLTADKQRVDWDAARGIINDKTKIVAITHASNVLGDIAPVKELALFAHQHGAIILVDGAQAIAHYSVDVKDLCVDLYAFSGHKMYGPTGIGVLYGRKALLERLEPQAWGGEMVEEVTLDTTTYAPLPQRFEPGTPNIAGAIGLGAAAEFLRSVGYDAIAKHEHDVLSYALEMLTVMPGVAVLGPQTAERRGGTIAFVIDGAHPHDIAHILASHGVAVRAGNHCAQPLHQELCLGATTRASIGVYTTTGDIDALVAGIKRVQEVFK